jgi:hypothetical protein
VNQCIPFIEDTPIHIKGTMTMFAFTTSQND